MSDHIHKKDRLGYFQQIDFEGDVKQIVIDRVELRKGDSNSPNSYSPVAVIDCEGLSFEEVEALEEYAQLISAAPELYEAVQLLLGVIDPISNMNDKVCIGKAVKALKKARGE